MGIRTNMLHDSFTRELKKLVNLAGDAGIDGRDLIGLLNDQVFDFDQDLKRAGLDMDRELPGWRDQPWHNKVDDLLAKKDSMLDYCQMFFDRHKRYPASIFEVAQFLDDERGRGQFANRHAVNEMYMAVNDPIAIARFNKLCAEKGLIPF